MDKKINRDLDFEEWSMRTFGISVAAALRKIANKHEEQAKLGMCLTSNY